ncbi:hypothetical protein [Arthrobacter sp. IK3]|uniref:hypothetical protein n=1 Tax=Arthrobacter sp. IK3 TaxID=3448169 RepID=UPI003EE1384F
MSEEPDPPRTLQRRCCSGKTCTTTLYLHTLVRDTGDGEKALPTLYRYRRGNENGFGPGWSTEARLAAWVAETAAADAAEDERLRRIEAENAAYDAERGK